MNPTDTQLPQAVPAFSGSLLQLTEDDLVILQTAIPQKSKDLAQDTLAFWRELPRLLADGEESRYALLHGGSIISLWDSLSDATQAGYDKFGADGRFLTACVKDLELQRIRQFLAQHRAK